MRIEKTIKGEKIPYKVQFVFGTMTATVMYFMDDEPIIGNISEDFKYIILPDTFLSPYISGHGKIRIGKLKLPKHLQNTAKEYNEKIKK